MEDVWECRKGNQKGSGGNRERGFPPQKTLQKRRQLWQSRFLQVEGLTARVEDKVILHEVGLTIKKERRMC